MKTFTDLFSSMSYVELVDLYSNLNKHFPDHHLIPWVEQEIELREEEMRAWEEYTLVTDMSKAFTVKD